MAKSYVALLRAVNVGGTGKLPMAELRRMCEGLGFQRVATYIQSGNVVFQSKLREAGVKRALEGALQAHMRKPVRVIVRTEAELRQVLLRNPYPDVAPNRVAVIFLDDPPPPGSLDGVVIPGREALSLDGRELFIHFPDGINKSKLKVPFQKIGTGRNLNTVFKLLEMVRALG